MKNGIESILEQHLPADWGDSERAKAKTAFYKALSLEGHRHYGGKIQVLPKAGLPSAEWYGAWYTPGVSAVSTAIRDNEDESFDLTWRGQTVAVVSDGTRVLGDGDVTPAGGMGVMEGKAYLMKMLGGIDAIPICINSRNASGEPDAGILVDCVERLAPSFGAINLEDISQPSCYRVLDELRERCSIPVWHDDAQGTGCVTVAGVLNALQVVGKRLDQVKIALNGAGAANTTIARLLLAAGARPENLALFDTRGGLHSGRDDLRADPRFYRKWELCQRTNPSKANRLQDWLQGADLLISLSKSGPGVIPGEWISRMASRAIVFVCANPVPEIYPHEALAAGAEIVATGRGDFPNQVNNAVGFPGILKGALLVRARKISDSMALAAAHAIADAVHRSGGPRADCIMPPMDDPFVHADVAAAVAEQAEREGLARRPLGKDAVLRKARADMEGARRAFEQLTQNGLIESPADEWLQKAAETAVRTLAQTPPEN